MRISDWSSDVCSSDLHPCLGQHPGPVTDRAHGLAGLNEGAHEGHCPLVGAQDVGIDLAARQHQRVVAGNIDLVDRLVDRDGITPVALFPTADLASLRRHDLDRSEEHTSELQSLMRIPYAVFCLKTNKQTTSHN